MHHLSKLALAGSAVLITAVVAIRDSSGKALLSGLLDKNLQLLGENLR
ncbi:MAG: hypothetical protein LPK11_00155 [Chromatiaceae bacterium]|nr:hypothetical protein [Chromatiaceae bacterium]